MLGVYLGIVGLDPLRATGAAVEALAVILVAAKLGGGLASRIGQPAVLGELLVGVVLGNVSLLGSSYRLCGHGIEKGGSYDTAKIATWAMMDGGASAGSGVVAGYSASGLTNLGLWKGTAAQYAAIGTKSSSTIYVVAG